MIAQASDWLALALLLSAFAWFASRRWIAVILPFTAIIAAFSLWVVTGTPCLTHPPAGHYTVIGADIKVDEFIYVLIKAEGPPVYYRLPYSAAQANALQQAEDAGNGQPGSVKMQVGENGGVSYDGPPPVSGEPPKQAEEPALNLP